MRCIFADAMYWVALASPQDQWHRRALQVGQALGRADIVTTEDVLVEFLAQFSGYGPLARMGAVLYVENVMHNPDITVCTQSHQSFLDGLALYKARPDKGYSLTDCISMTTIRQLGITEVLSRDNHFVQEGFTCLL